MTDEQRTDSISAYGGQPAVRTPALDSIAGCGVLFANAFCNSPVCMPSRAAQITGRYPHSNGVMCNDMRVRLPCDQVVLPGLFREAGYHTANFGKAHFGRWKRDGDDMGFEVSEGVSTRIRLGMIEPALGRPGGVPDARDYGPPFALSGVDPNGRDGTQTALLTDRAIRYLEGREYGDRPFFLRVSYGAPHSPYLAPEPFDRMYAKADLRVPQPDPEDVASLPALLRRHREEYRRLSLLNEEDYSLLCVSYYGLVAHVDDQLSRILAALDRLGLRENTIVAFNSDHGILLGEHGFIEKHPHHYDEELRVPFLLSWPGRLPSGRRFNGQVELIDFMPTVLDLAGLPIPDQVQGKSLVPQATGAAKAGKVRVFSEGGGGNLIRSSGIPKLLKEAGAASRGLGGWDDRRRVCVRTKAWKMVIYNWGLEDEEAQLFDLRRDPKEERNLAGDPGCAAIRSQLQQDIETWYKNYPWHESLNEMVSFAPASSR